MYNVREISWAFSSVYRMHNATQLKLDAPAYHGSQCNCNKLGVMCSLGLSTNINRAAAFCTRCNDGSSVASGTEAKLQ